MKLKLLPVIACRVAHIPPGMLVSLHSAAGSVTPAVNGTFAYRRRYMQVLWSNGTSVRTDLSENCDLSRPPSRSLKIIGTDTNRSATSYVFY